MGMTPSRELLLAAYNQACALEIQLWEQVEHCGPGHMGHDALAWKNWLEAVEAVSVAEDALRVSISRT